MTEFIFGAVYALGFAAAIVTPLALLDLFFTMAYNRSAKFRNLAERTLGDLPAWKYK